MTTKTTRTILGVKRIVEYELLLLSNYDELINQIEVSISPDLVLPLRGMGLDDAISLLCNGFQLMEKSNFTSAGIRQLQDYNRHRDTRIQSS